MGNERRWQIELLDASHDRSNFSCGKAQLDEYLKTRAGQSARNDAGRTFVAVRPEERAVRGYYTLAMTSVAVEAMPEHLQEKVPNPVPAALIGRLAVDESCQGQGLGKYLLLDALRRIVGAGASIAAYAVVLDAIDEDAKSFYVHFGFESLLDDPNHLFLSIKKVRLLPLTV